jgi:hypothetical protein
MELKRDGVEQSNNTVALELLVMVVSRLARPAVSGVLVVAV